MLTVEQQQTIENSIWVVNTALKRQGLTDNADLRQSAIMFMCKCITNFDPNRGIKWTTYAYKNVYLFIKHRHAKEKKKEENLLPLDIADIDEIRDDWQDNKIDGMVRGYRISKIMALCNEIEREVIKYRLKGFSNLEIAKMLKCSTSRINLYMRSIKNKAREENL